MAGSSGDTKDVDKEAAEGASENTATPKAAEEPSKASVAAALPRRMPALKVDARMAAAATVALVVGTGFGMLAAPRGHSSEALARIEAGLQAGQGEAARLAADLDGLSRALAALREVGETGRSEAKTVAAGVAERLTRMEQGLDRRIAALSETVVRVEREAAAPVAATPAQPEKRAATPVAAAIAPVAVLAAPVKPEPTQTASIETRPKSETIETWALRDVYDGVAMLEDRKRRLVEVAPGDAVPGIGRVEAIERRGRNWVVVTRQGLITPQMW